MKIELQISTDTLIAANEILQSIYDLPVSINKRENVYKSIGYEVADKIGTRVKTLKKNANLFQNKKSKLTLKYHEAWALEEILKDLQQHVEVTNEYRKSLIQGLINKLNQKLA